MCMRMYSYEYCKYISAQKYIHTYMQPDAHAHSNCHRGNSVAVKKTVILSATNG